MNADRIFAIGVALLAALGLFDHGDIGLCILVVFLASLAVWALEDETLKKSAVVADSIRAAALILVAIICTEQFLAITAHERGADYASHAVVQMVDDWKAGRRTDVSETPPSDPPPAVATYVVHSTPENHTYSMPLEPVIISAVDAEAARVSGYLVVAGILLCVILFACKVVAAVTYTLAQLVPDE